MAISEKLALEERARWLYTQHAKPHTAAILINHCVAEATKSNPSDPFAGRRARTHLALAISTPEDFRS